MIVQTPLFNDKISFSFCFHRREKTRRLFAKAQIHCLCWVRKPIIEIAIIADKLCWHFFYHSVGRLLDFSHFTWWYSASINSSDLTKWEKMLKEKKVWPVLGQCDDKLFIGYCFWILAISFRFFLSVGFRQLFTRFLLLIVMSDTIEFLLLSKSLGFV